MKTILKRFDTPDEVRHFELGKFELVRVGRRILGRATYQPGWKWSEHVAPRVGKALCDVEHLGLVLAGRAAVQFEDGRVEHLEAGTVFYVPSQPHDSWVVGDEPYVSIHLEGAGGYATSE